MKRFVLITSALVALVATGAAVAHLKATDVSAVSATLTATTPSNVQTQHVHVRGTDFRGDDRALVRHVHEHDA